MAQQRQPEESPALTEVLKLVDKLSPKDRETLCRKLDLKGWGERWRALCSEVDEQNKDLPAIAEQEIVSELKELRRETRGQRDQSSS